MSVSDSPAMPEPVQAARDAFELDRNLWSSFANARNDKAFLSGWLAVLVNKIPDATLGVLIEADSEAGAFVPVAIVPDPRRDLAGVRQVAEKCLETGRPATRRDGEGNATWAAHPVRVADGPVGAVIVLELTGSHDDAVQQALRELHWAAGWLAAQEWQKKAQAEAKRTVRAAVALDILALASEQDKPEAAALAIVNEAQTVLNCDRVSIGLLKGARTSPRIRLMSLSYSAWFRKRAAMVESLETAMEEAFDQGAAVSYPALPSLERNISIAHADHVRATQTKHMFSVPLRDDKGPIGVLACERREEAAFDDDTLMMAESIGALIGPMLDLKRRNRRWFGGRIVDGVLHVFGVLLGPRRLSWKVLALAVIALVIAAATVQGPFRVQADAVLRGQEQRAAVAPFAGFIAEAPLRAGDVVAAGDLLVRLDDSDLRLEQLRWQSELDRLRSQSREALAEYDRAQVALLEAQIAQAQAQLALAQAQLARAQIIAPIDGLIVTGDLSQRLGAPVQIGEVLFEIAPKDQYRLDVFVDERDLGHVEVNTTGWLALSGTPTDRIPIMVNRITPIAEAREGVNTFRVEGALTALRPYLRPGMEGVAKIDAGRALYSWSWSRRLVGWMRETLWTWQP